jgi:hypothetical protein
MSTNTSIQSEQQLSLSGQQSLLTSATAIQSGQQSTSTNTIHSNNQSSNRSNEFSLVMAMKLLFTKNVPMLRCYSIVNHPKLSQIAIQDAIYGGKVFLF